MRWISFVAIGLVSVSAGYWFGDRAGSAASAQAVVVDTVDGVAEARQAQGAAIERVVERLRRREHSCGYAYREAEFLSEMKADGDDGTRFGGPGDSESYNLLRTLFEDWAKRAPDAAITAALEVEGEQRWEVIDGTLAGLFAIDCELALRFYEGLDRSEQNWGVVDHFSEKDAIRGVDWLIAEIESRKVPLERRWDFFVELGMARLLPPAHRDGVFARAERLGWKPTIPSVWVRGQAASRNIIARSDPKAALEQITRDTPYILLDWDEREDSGVPFWGEGRMFAERVLTHGMAEAESSLAELPLGNFRREFVVELGRRMAALDPGAALAWLKGVEDPKERYLAARGVSEAIAARDPRGALAMLRSGAGGDDLVEDIVVEAAVQQDAAWAFGWLRERVDTDVNSTKELLEETRLFNVWAEQNPPAAARAAMGVVDGSSFVKAVIRGWAEAEPWHASQFIRDQMEPGEVRDAAVVALIAEIKEDDLNGAMAWAREISDQALMFQTMDSLATE